MRTLGMRLAALGLAVSACTTQRVDPGESTQMGSGSSDSEVDSASSTEGEGDAGSSTGGANTTTGSSSSSGSSESTAGEIVCPEVDGTYYVGYDFDQRQVCTDALTTTNACGVTQDGCQLYWGCNGAFEDYLPPGPVDADGVYYGEGTFQGGTLTCTIIFSLRDHLFDWECIVPDGTVCTGGGF